MKGLLDILDRGILLFHFSVLFLKEQLIENNG